ncbi:hypothetical protein KSP39_PZI003715 [Platanthera zijinensis]|uniref:Ribosomal RNA small subunit methyltransferase G n=1 Tax=Platanthera zijinensis TaxID=2320716 RepID=A0AAP0GD65_9ASPA
MLALSTNVFLSPFRSLSRRHICTHGCPRLPLLLPLFSFSFSRRSNTSVALEYAAAASSGRDFIETPVCHAVDGTIHGSLSSLQKEQISIFVSALLEWNERMNLTAAMQESEVMTRHVEDSLALLPPLRRSYLSMCSSSPSSSSSPSCDGIKLVDVGSGSGLPGLIIAIACPTWKVTLLESMQKRCSFLEYVVGLTNLSNVEVLRERAENVGQCADFRELFDVAVARAVAEMRILGW